MLSSHQKPAIVQFLKFNIVGLLNTAIDFIAYSIFIWAGIYFVLAQLVSYTAGMLNSYIWNSRFTFVDKRQPKKDRPDFGRMLRFTVWNLIVLGISVLLLVGFTEYTSVGALYAKAIVTVITVAINFIGSKRFVFYK